MPSKKIKVENVIRPGSPARNVDSAKYESMKTALLKVLPDMAPGLTVAEARSQLLPHLPQDLFPGGAKAGWWLKSVQLDLEAKGMVQRVTTKPLRLHKA